MYPTSRVRNEVLRQNIQKTWPPLPIPQQNLNNLTSSSNTVRVSVAAEAVCFCSQSKISGRVHIT